MSSPHPQCAELGYHPFSRYLRGRFGCKVHKVSLHAGFTCPNRDGRVGVGGCTYCINDSFSPQAGRALRSIGEQMREGMEYMRRRFRAEKFIAYFQAYSNTYSDATTLRRAYDEAVAFPQVVGLSIGTRPDCVPDDVLDLISGYAPRLDVWLEYGLQSAHDETLRRINRGHGIAAFLDAVARARKRGINTCVHVILGLPGETHEQMMQTAELIGSLDIQAVKLHHLYVARGAALEADYRAGRVTLYDAPDYVRAACDFLERIPPQVVVQRLCGDTTSAGVLIAPVWDASKSRVLTMVTEEFRLRGTCQGWRLTSDG